MREKWLLSMIINFALRTGFVLMVSKLTTLAKNHGTRLVCFGIKNSQNMTAALES
jgi:hypothetical protein